MTAECAAPGCSYIAGDKSGGLLCSQCSHKADPVRLEVLSLLKGVASDVGCRKLAAGLVTGDSDAKRILDDVSVATQSKDVRLLIIVEPPVAVEVGTGPASLSCEALCFGGGPLRYQWCKDGEPVKRAERARFPLMGAGPRDEGSYSCSVSCGDVSVRTRAVQVRLSTGESSRHTRKVEQQARFESLLLRAAEAESLGRTQAAGGLLTEAVAEAGDDNDTQRAEALCKRAEFFVKLSRWQDAFRDATESVKTLPGHGRAHAARGAAAENLGFLAEAVSSWEAAELFGGGSEAASRAGACRQRLDEFFAAQQARQNFEAPGSEGTGNDGKDPESSWHRSGFEGPYRGGFRGNQASGEAGHASRFSNRVGALSADLRRHFAVLGFSINGPADLPPIAAVRKAYRSLALTLHPDKPNGSKMAFQELQTAYEAVLRALG